MSGGEQLELGFAAPRAVATEVEWPPAPMVCIACPLYGWPHDVHMASPAMAFVHRRMHEHPDETAPPRRVRGGER